MHKLKNPWILTGILLLVGGIAALSWQYSSKPNQTGASDLVIPKLSPLAAQGQMVFNANCARCHGVNAMGTNAGPPLIHDIYNPGHHGDAAFYRAVKQGSPQHHWSFGSMPPQPQVNDDEIAAIIRFIRETQEANGIVYRKHQM